MRIFFWFVVSNVLLALTNSGLAQDSLTFNTTTLTLAPSTVIDASTAFRWRLSGAVGYHQQVQNESIEKSLYLNSGLHATVAADYFIGRNWGLGLLIGYQNLAVSDAYKRDRGIPRSSDNALPIFSSITAFQSFMVAVGPAFSIPLGQRFTFDLDGRIGGFYNDAPIIRAYDASSKDPLLTVTPGNERFRLGFTGSVGVKYRLTQQFGLGVSGSVNYTSFDYTQVTYSNPTQNHVNLNLYGVQATLSYRFLSAPRARSAPAAGATATAVVVNPKPGCYPPIIDPAQQDEYEAGSPRRPVIRWRSSAPIYTEGEQYVFRLYTLPGNKLVYERTIQEPQISWPAQLAIPDTASYFFYSLYTSRSDDLEQTCRSEPVVGTLGFFSSQSPAPTKKVTSREPAAAFTLKLYELQPTLVLQKAVIQPVVAKAKSAKRSTKTARSGRSQPTKSAKLPTMPSADSLRADSARLAMNQPDSVRARSMATDSLRSRSMTTDSARARSIAADSAQSDSMVTVMRIVPNLLYEEPTQQLRFSWSGKASLPAQPTVYQYTITNNTTNDLIQSYYLMVEPDGCFVIITEVMKNKYLRNSIPPNTKPVLESTQPTNKEKP